MYQEKKKLIFSQAKKQVHKFYFSSHSKPLNYPSQPSNPKKRYFIRTKRLTRLKQALNALKGDVKMKSLENMTIEELLKEIKQLHVATNFSPIKLATDGKNLLLDKNNPADRSWFENDEEYDLI